MSAAVGPTIHDAAHLRVVPDGTVISWFRIPGDRTSEAVAFVRREVEQELDPDGRPGHTGVVIWVSPGGWDPHTIEEAGVTFPAQVVRWGDFNFETMPVNELPLLTECIHGGTWSREKALECAVTYWSGMSITEDAVAEARQVLVTAESFQHWLDRELAPQPPDPEAEVVLDQAPTLGELAEHLTRLKDVGVTSESLEFAARKVWWE